MKKVKALIAAVLLAAVFTSCKSEIAQEVNVVEETARNAVSFENVEEKEETPKRITGYFCEWGIYAAHGNYFPQHIPYDKLTHINYAFVGLNPSTQAVEIYDSWATSEIVNDGEKWDTEYKGCLGLLRKYKAKYPHVKVLISVGGWTKSHGFHNAAATEETRARAAKNLVDFVVQNNLDGVDIDWEYPGVHRDKDGNDQFDMGCPGGIEDKEKFPLFLKAIRDALDAQGRIDGKKYELTAAIGVGYDKIAVTNPGEYSKYLDALNLMSYDMHGAFEPTTGHQAPLYANIEHDNNPSREVVEKYNIDWAVQEFLRQGVPASKIVIGLPFYSRGWNNVSGGWDVDGNGTPDGMFGNGGSTLAGTWGVGGQSPYYEVKALEGTAGWEKFRDPISKACWLYNRSKGELYTYDDAETIKTKLNYIKELNLGGAMYWELDGDDWKNGSNELINIIADAILDDAVFDVDTTKPVVTPTNPSEQENPSNPSNPDDNNGETNPSNPDVTVPSVTDGGKATGVPGTPSLEQTSWNGESTFGLRMNMWWGQNGTVIELLENGKTVQAYALEDNSPSAQSYTFTVSGKANGTYEYQVRLTNKFGSTMSKVVTYTVTQGTGSTPVVTPTNPTQPSNPGNDDETPSTDPELPPATSIDVEGLPTYVLTGYWQNFNNGAKVLRISDVPEAYNIICVSFGESTFTPGEVVFNLDPSLGFSKAQFIADIATVKARGQHVILSVGGETGNVLINSDAAAATFARSITNLMNEYGFEGVDIDLEHGINATYISKALRAIPSGSIITMAPQTIDMQSTGMEYFKLALAISDILTINNMQYYNSGSMLGYNGAVYAQGNEDFLTGLATIQLENGLRPDQVGLGLPASTRGAGSGYVDPQIIINAMDTLITGAKHGSYVPPRKYPGLRGVMTWSINWDASNNWNFANKIGAYLAKLNNTEFETPTNPSNPGNPDVGSDPTGPVLDEGTYVGTDIIIDDPYSKPIHVIFEENAVFYIQPACSRNMALDGDAWGTTNGTNVIQWTLGDNQANQKWIVHNVGDTGYVWFENNYSGLALDVDGAKTNAGANVQLWEYVGEPQQQWKVLKHSPYFYEIQNRKSGLVLDISNASMDAGANLQQWTSNNSAAQYFRLLPTTKGNKNDNTVEPVDPTEPSNPSNPGTGSDNNTGAIPSWAAGVTYGMGDVIVYNGIVYTCTFPHTSIVSWEPGPGTAALWKEGGTYTGNTNENTGNNNSSNNGNTENTTPSQPQNPSYEEPVDGPVNATLPARIMSGYWHNWDGGVPFIPLSKVDSSWDVINVSFAEPVTPGSGNGNMKFSVANKDGYNLAQFKADVKTLHNRGKKVVLSIGGYEGYFYLENATAVNNFVSQINALVDEYGFDGIDIDLEQSSVQLNSGNDPDFRNVKTPRIQNMISAIRQICDAHGENFILSWAPETFYMQLGHQFYGGANGYVDSRAGAYLAMVYALRDKTTYVQTQLYNSSPIVGRDGQYYNMGTVEGIVEMCNMLLEGFTVNNDSSKVFPALRADQVVIAVPCSSGAAGSGQISNANLQAAYRQINAKHPGLRGIMTWSINWDAYQNGNSFGRENRAFLNQF